MGQYMHSSQLAPHRSDVILEELSQAATQSYRSSKEAMYAAVRLIADHLGLRTGLVTHIDRNASELQVVATQNAPGGCGVEPVAAIPLPDTI